MPAPPYLLIQISDIHFTPDGYMSPDGMPASSVRPTQNLTNALDVLATSGIQPDALLLTGDLANAGEAHCYQELAALLRARTPETQVVFLPGNHDARAAFRTHLLGEPGGGSEPINQIAWVGGVRIVAIDSTVPGQDWGEVGDETAAFLRATLATRAPEGTVLALHHPPIPSPIEPLTTIALRNPDRLAELIAGTDVRIVVCGHYHHEGVGTLASVPVWVSPACAYRADVTSRATFRGVPGSAVSRIDISGDDLTISVIPVPLTAAR